jgi:hypothetical protein
MNHPTDQRNDGLHPRHPGRGKCSVIELEAEGDHPEHGGFLIFLPSGATKSARWKSAACITPTLEAAKDYCAKIIESLIEAGGPDHPDIHNTNWTSVCAAVQRTIIDFNSKLYARINAKMARDLMNPQQKRWVQ